MISKTPEMKRSHRADVVFQKSELKKYLGKTFGPVAGNQKMLLFLRISFFLKTFCFFLANVLHHFKWGRVPPDRSDDLKNPRNEEISSS